MVRCLVVCLAEQHDPALRECHDHVIPFFITPEIGPGARRHAAVGLRGAIILRSD